MSTLSQLKMVYQVYVVGAFVGTMVTKYDSCVWKEPHKKYYSLNRITKSSYFYIDGLVQDCCNSSANALK